MTYQAKVGFTILTALFVVGVVYGYSGGTIPSEAVMIGGTVGATIFGIAAVTVN